MKICLLANPRSGSTSLYSLIQSHLPTEYYCVSEPFNTEYMNYISDIRSHLTEIEKSEHVFLKNICYQYPSKFSNKESWHEWLFKNFDKIILLDRKNKIEQSESFVYHESKNRANWHMRSYYDLSNIDESKIEDRVKKLEQDAQILITNSNRFPLFYYEDIFIDKNETVINSLFNYLGIDPIQKYIDKFIISDIKKVRIFVEKRTLL